VGPFRGTTLHLGTFPKDAKSVLKANITCTKMHNNLKKENNAPVNRFRTINKAKIIQICLNFEFCKLFALLKM